MQGPLFPFEIANTCDAFVQILEPIGRDDGWALKRTPRGRRDEDEPEMTRILTFPAPKGGGVVARTRRLGAFLRRCGAALLMGLHEQRRREAARLLTHARYIDGLGHAARIDADARPKVVALRRSPATQPAQDAGSV
jgi:hypothetical protein